MAAKGATAKQAIFSKLLETFEGSFMYNGGKELRIPWEEASGPVEIKVTLTAAKELVGNAAEAITAPVDIDMGNVMNFPEPRVNLEPSAEEKQNVEDLLKALDLK